MWNVCSVPLGCARWDYGRWCVIECVGGGREMWRLCVIDLPTEDDDEYSKQGRNSSCRELKRATSKIGHPDCISAFDSIEEWKTLLFVVVFPWFSVIESAPRGKRVEKDEREGESERVQSDCRCLYPLIGMRMFVIVPRGKAAACNISAPSYGRNGESYTHQVRKTLELTNEGRGVDQRDRLECSHDDVMFIMCTCVYSLQCLWRSIRSLRDWGSWRGRWTVDWEVNEPSWEDK